MRGDREKLINLLNKSRPISIEIDPFAGRVTMSFQSIDELLITIVLSETQGRLRVKIRNESAQLNLLTYEIREGEIDDEPLTYEEQQAFHQRYGHTSQRNNEISESDNAV